MALSIAQVYNLARGVGLSHHQAVIATAIAMAESGLNPGAVGDVALEDATWGPSEGLWQVRSLKAQRGTGQTRDATRLTDPQFNARSMYEISDGGRNFEPWSTYVDNAYVGHLAAVRNAVGKDGRDAAGAPPAGGAQPVSFTGGDLGTGITPLLPWGTGGGGSGNGIASSLRDLVLVGLFVAGGAVLVLVGAHAAVSEAS
jgi:hypothetical protein